MTSDTQSIQNSDLFDNIIFAAGPPRSGTTLLAEVLNAHPQLALVSTNVVLEHWSLYDYLTHTGLVQTIRENTLSYDAIQQQLLAAIIEDDVVKYVASSPKLAQFPTVTARNHDRERHLTELYGKANRNPSLLFRIQRFLKRTRNNLLNPKKQLKPGHIRHDVPVAFFRNNLRLVMKSPEITLVIPQLLDIFPKSKFIVTYRPTLEIAYSMYQHGERGKINTFHQRWKIDYDREGFVPPAVEQEWIDVWDSATDFQRCVIMGASYLKPMAAVASWNNKQRIFVYPHHQMRKNPLQYWQAVAKFLNISSDGFMSAINIIDAKIPDVPDRLMQEYQQIAPVVKADDWVREVEKHLSISEIETE